MQQMSAGVEDKHLVMVGGGHAHVQILRQLRMAPIPNLRVTLISSESQSPYSGMLPGHLGGWYTFSESHFDLIRLCERAGVRFLHDSVTGLDTNEHRVRLARRPSIGYDLLSLNTGVTPCLPEGMRPGPRHIPLKPISRFLPQWHAVVDTLIKRKSKLPRFAFVGGGAAGVELSLLLARKAQESGASVQIDLIEAQSRVMPSHPGAMSRKMMRYLERAGVQVHLSKKVVRALAEGEIELDSGEKLFCEAVFWSTQGLAPDWIRASGLAVDESGSLRVEATLQALGHPSIFGAGDCVRLEGRAPLPKTGVFAVREGPVLNKNIRAKLSGESLERYRPQKRFLSLVTTGAKNAIASWGPFCVEIPGLLWPWKDRIDRAFMQKFSQVEISNDSLMLCGGCGSKVGAPTLLKVLDGLGMSDASLDDIALVPSARGIEGALAQSIDYIEDLVSDPYVFGRIATLHALSDLHARGIRPSSALILAKVPRASIVRVEDDLTHLLVGSREVLEQEKVRAIGGHSLQGEKLGLGLALTGEVVEGSPLRLREPRAGDAIVLTHALGIGVVMAAYRRGLAEGLVVEEALRLMSRSKRETAEILSRFEIHACTDVTGFGLAGHLKNLLAAHHLGAHLSLNSIPRLSAVEKLFALGLESSIAAANRARFTNEELSVSPGLRELDLSILWDPQTSGGFLALVAPSQTDGLVRELQAFGDQHASCIGHIQEGSILRVEP